MKYLNFVVAPLLLFLAACGGGGSGSSNLEPLPPAVTAPSGALSGTRSAAQYQGTLQALATSGANDLLYVGNAGDDSITVYKHSASGNAAPIYVIAGSKTGIDAPGQLSEDAQGNLYVANTDSKAPAILVFAHGANGNVAPIRKLAGLSTGMHSVRAMTVDQATGNLFVVDWITGPFNELSLLRFPANAAGNLPPSARSAAILEPANQIASDSTGKNVIVSHSALCCSNLFAGVETMAKQYPNNGGALSYQIDSFVVGGVADDPTTKTYLVASSNGIYRLAENTIGNGSAEGNPFHVTPAPVSIITSDSCRSQLAVAPGPAPYTYAMHSKAYGCPADAVYVYANNASGKAAPVRILSGPATKMNQPYGITEGL